MNALTAFIPTAGWLMWVQTAIQTRLLSPCKRMDESEVADLIVKLGALKEALRECENWREVEREKHQQAGLAAIEDILPINTLHCHNAMNPLCMYTCPQMPFVM